MTTHITATFAISAGHYGECDVDITGLPLDEIAEHVFNEAAPDTTLCHQCDDNISDPEVTEMTSFTIDGIDYIQQGDHWVRDKRDT